MSWRLNTIQIITTTDDTIRPRSHNDVTLTEQVKALLTQQTPHIRNEQAKSTGTEQADFPFVNRYAYTHSMRRHTSTLPFSVFTDYKLKHAQYYAWHNAMCSDTHTISFFIVLLSRNDFCYFICPVSLSKIGILQVYYKHQQRREQSNDHDFIALLNYLPL